MSHGVGFYTHLTAECMQRSEIEQRRILIRIRAIRRVCMWKTFMRGDEALKIFVREMYFIWILRIINQKQNG